MSEKENYSKPCIDISQFKGEDVMFTVSAVSYGADKKPANVKFTIGRLNQ